LQKQLPNAGFPFLVANYNFGSTPLAGRFQPYKVFEKAGARIGVFGLGIELKGLVADKNFGTTQYLDPVATAKAQVQQLRQNERCDMVICLSHLGYKYEGEKTHAHFYACTRADYGAEWARHAYQPGGLVGHQPRAHRLRAAARSAAGAGRGRAGAAHKRYLLAARH
jgi:2',3'-cyclic-nucleotide 2'-phosphodiesterase (5'-nucleotidase family)